MTDSTWRAIVVSLLLPILWACIGLRHKLLPSSRVKHSSSEPPQISSTIPYIGHLIGILIHKNHYYTQLCKRFQFPILKLPILTGQLYLVTSPKLLAAIERKPNLISFWHVEASAIGRVAGLRPEAHKLVSEGVGDNPESFWLKGLRAIHHAMAPGKGINDMILVAARTSLKTLREFDDAHPDAHPRRVDLWEWVSHEVTVAHTDAVYGVGNPYRDSEVEKGFWAFSHDSYKLLLSQRFSRFLAPSAYRGRETVVSAFKSYFQNLTADNQSALMRARMANLSSLEEIEDMARMECVNGLAILANTVPSAFWTIVQIYSSPALLARVRETVEGAVENVTGEEGKTGKKVLSLQKLLHPTSPSPTHLNLQSLIQETIRLRTTGIGPRFVRQDTTLQDRYQLKAGSMLIIPNRAIHFDRDVWGEGVEGFDEQRFSNNRIDGGKKAVSATAYRGFGGGATICPGKWFAVEGIAALVALVVGRYDVVPLKGRTWGDLNQEMRDMALQLGSPEGKFEVEFRVREGMGEGVEWDVVCQ